MKRKIAVAACYLLAGASAIYLFKGYFPAVFTALGFYALGEHFEK